MTLLYKAFGWLLFQIYSFVGNYGVAIILFTILFKLILLPLNLKQTKSMKETQAIQPELEKLKKKYKNNQEKLNAETMKLYKLYNISPMAGCLPLLLQLPIIYGLFGVLRNADTYVFCYATETVAEAGKFLWISDLSGTDPYYILPILCAIFTFLTQKITMKYQNNTDDSMAMTTNLMLYLMPVIIGFAALRMPAGVALYWVVQNVFTLVQQWLCMRKPLELKPIEEVEKTLEDSKAEEKAAKKKQRQMNSEMRERAMRGQSGADDQNKKEKSKPKTKPASSKNVRKTITKIPGQEPDQSGRKTITKIPGQDD